MNFLTTCFSGQNLTQEISWLIWNHLIVSSRLIVLYPLLKLLQGENGSIWAESREGAGSKLFLVYLFVKVN